MNQMSFPLEGKCGSILVDLLHLSIMGCEVGEWDAGHCDQRLCSNAGQPSPRKLRAGVWGLVGTSHTFLLLRLPDTPS